MQNTTDNEFVELHWEYPIFIIGTADAGGVVPVDFEGYSCCLIYKQKELAELYIEQAAQAGGETYHAIPISTSQEFHNGLSSLKPQGIGHVIWDATFHPSGCKVAAIDDLLAIVSRG